MRTEGESVPHPQHQLLESLVLRLCWMWGGGRDMAAAVPSGWGEAQGPNSDIQEAAEWLCPPRPEKRDLLF